ncbi:hypothetical protein T01_1917 [Trichinella spiralis]|uniref:Uncharacterized protein n=1 Tax=Trichinella spiralis TaxID=6334 RepID=A0A0V1BUX5_TRISP|nr:hypothetical protein T01_1917 [Trichinella spiralis]
MLSREMLCISCKLSQDRTKLASSAFLVILWPLDLFGNQLIPHCEQTWTLMVYQLLEEVLFSWVVALLDQSNLVGEAERLTDIRYICSRHAKGLIARYSNRRHPYEGCSF